MNARVDVGAIDYMGGDTIADLLEDVDGDLIVLRDDLKKLEAKGIFVAIESNEVDEIRFDVKQTLEQVEKTMQTIENRYFPNDRDFM